MKFAPLALVAALTACASPLPAQTTQPAAPETPAQREARMAWFREARFGMFVHWGLYAVPAGKYGDKTNYGEWIMQEAKIPTSEYAQYVDRFNPQKFDARAWVKAAKDAGCGYIVITSKHHDGFALYPSKLSDWNISSTPFRRDPLQELAEACNEAGVRLCFYHSIMDWHHPNYAPRRPWNDTAAKVSPQPDMDKYVAYMKGQLKELLSNYGPIGILWFDGEWENTWDDARGRDLYHYVRSLQPDIIINNRVAKSRTGMAGMSVGEKIGDYGTPEQQIPASGFPPVNGSPVDWESCMTMNDHWGYNAANNNFKSTQTLIRNLVDCASKGGNYLLNVGPTAEGLIPQPSLERLAEMGKWMAVNAESIRGTTASPFRRLPWGRATRKGNSLYLHIFTWPEGGKLTIPMAGAASTPILLAAPNTQIALSSDAAGVHLTLPATAPDAYDTVIKLTVGPDFAPLNVLPGQDPAGKLTLTADDVTLPSESPIQIEAVTKAGPSLGYWTDLSAPSWTFEITRPGTFKLDLLLACNPPSAGSEITIAGAAEQLTFAVPATKSWRDFQPHSPGTLTFPAPGRYTLTLTPKSKKGEAIMNLHSLSLTPSK